MLNKVLFGKDSTQSIDMDVYAEFTEGLVVWVMLWQLRAPMCIFPDCICQFLEKAPHRKTINNCYFHVRKITWLIKHKK